MRFLLHMSDRGRPSVLATALNAMLAGGLLVFVFVSVHLATP